MNNLLFDFTVDKPNNTVFVTREFIAELSDVWDAFTKPEILDQWWAPQPWLSKTKQMDFKVGGRRFYAMVSPEGHEHWCIQDYTSIKPKTNFQFIDAFADKDENINLDFPSSEWDLNFYEHNNQTTVKIAIKHKTLADLEQIIQMGFKEGFTAGLNQLENYIENQFYLRQQNKKMNTPRVSTYINLPGNTEEAFNFYKKIFKTEFVNGISRFGDIPSDSNQPPLPESVKKLILHIELPILGGHILMGTDASKDMGFNVTFGNNMHINLEPETREEATRLFHELSEGGKVEMPIQDMFWGAYYGSFTDIFGINWMINHQNKH